MANETPTETLHNLAVHESGRPPNFQLITQKVNTHETEFEFMVEALGIQATGHGRSLKEAKHEASKNALLILDQRRQLESSQEDDTDAEATDWNVRIRDYPYHFKKLMIEKNIANEDIEMYFDLPRSEDTLKQLLDKLDLTYSVTIDDGLYCKIAIINVDTAIPLCTMGSGVTSDIAKVEALNLLFSQIQTLASAIIYTDTE